MPKNSDTCTITRYDLLVIVQSPIYLYTDDVIGILPKRNLNNGQPSRHAALIAAAAPQPGEHVLAYRRRRRLLHGNSRRAGRRHGEGDGDRIRCRARRPRYGEFRADAACPRGARDGTRVLFEPADVIYVNAGAMRPADIPRA